MPANQNLNRHSWVQKFIAGIALLNLLLVWFNLSYLPLRDTYFKHTPWLVRIYDPVKAIEPHPDTMVYLQTCDRLKQKLAEGASIAETEGLLASLRQQSIYLIEENPFLSANQLGTFAKLKHRLEYRLSTRSTKQAFSRFWSQSYLSQENIAEELNFFSDRIEPLLKTNYYRRVNANGSEIDNFWRLDLAFVIFLAIEYLVRTFWVARQGDKLNWGQAMLRYWYDLLMLVPVYRWLRIIPVTVRIHKSGLFDLESILLHVTHEPAAYISHRVSTFLIVRLLNQSQEIIGNSAIADTFLAESDITVGETDKLDKIADRLISLTIYQVLPHVQPDLENLLRYSLKAAIQESDLYQTARGIPGLASLPQSTIEQLADYLAQTTYDVLINSYTDTEGKIIFNRLSKNFASSLKQEIQNKTTQSEIQILLSDLLEEWKLNYIKNSQQRDPETTLAEAEQIKSAIN